MRYWILTLFLFIASTNGVSGHTPHDPIDALAVSPVYDRDKTLFIAISDQLFRSTTGGQSWKELINGLDNTGLISSIAISPNFDTDGTLYLTSKNEGIYFSEDRGLHWKHLRNKLNHADIGKVFISPKFDQDGMIFAIGETGGLFRSSDRGYHWQSVINDTHKITSMTFYQQNETLNCLIGDNSGRLFNSLDTGLSWQESLEIPGGGMLTTIKTVGEGLDRIFFIGTEKKGLYKLKEEARTVDGLSPLFGEKYITDVAISPAYMKDTTVLAVTWREAVYISKDRGQTWQKFSQGVTKDKQADSEHYRSPHFRTINFSNSFESDQTIYLGGFTGIFKTQDGGKDWFELEVLRVGNIKGIGVSPSSSGNYSIGLTTYGAGIYLSEDKGKSWAICNTGLTRTRISDLVFSPNYHADGQIFSASQGRLLKWNDDDRIWSGTSLRQHNWRNKLHSILKRMGRLGSLLRSHIRKPPSKPWPTSIAISPGYQFDRTLFFATRWNGIYRSTDGGAHNVLQWDAGGRPIKSLVISPDFTADKTLFFGIRGEGVFRSKDGGNSFQATNDGLDFVKDWKQSETRHQTSKKDINLVISPNYKLDQTLLCASSEGLYISRNGGDTWRKAPEGRTNRSGYILAIAISESANKRPVLIVSVKGLGLFKSEDLGLSFSPIGGTLIKNNHKIEHIVFSRNYKLDKTIYAASDEQLFVSSDGGQKWRIVSRPVRYENHRDVINYKGDWHTLKGDQFSATSLHESNMLKSRASLNFIGTGVKYIGTTSNEHGVAELYIDGRLLAEIDQYSPETHSLVTLYTVDNLTVGPHSIEIEVTNKKNPASKGFKTSLDAFDIIP